MQLTRITLLSLLFALVLACSSVPRASSPARRVASEAPQPWSFAVISDVHVYTDGRIPSEFPKVVAALVALHPRLVIVTGDSTSGNLGDHFTEKRADLWWSSFKDAIQPLEEAGIPVYPVAGNHDFYRPPHQAAYVAAWPGKPEPQGSAPPLYYSFDIDDVHFSLLHVVDQRLEPRVREFLEADFARAEGARLRFAFGHVPLISVMGHTSQEFRAELGGLLAAHHYDAYIAGHEHLVWDERLELPEGKVRQVIVGTSSGSYDFPLSRVSYEHHCQDSRCTMPATGASFEVDPETRYERHKVSYTVVEVSADGYQVRPFAIAADGNAVPFYSQ